MNGVPIATFLLFVEKFFDSVDRKQILKILGNYDMPKKTINLIKECIVGIMDRLFPEGALAEYFCIMN